MFLLMVTLFACSNDEQALQQETEKTTSSVSQKNLNGQIPFTVENVQQALANVLAYYDETKPDVANRFRNYSVVPTHVYYKFTPADGLQYGLLMDQEEVLNLTTNPLEHNIGEKTEDPSDGEIPAFYAVVSTEQSLPDVPHEQVAVLHFTNEDSLEDAEHNYDEIEFKQNLMYEARKLAGHLDDEELAAGYLDIRKEDNELRGEKAAKGWFPKKWRPSGTVQVEEDVLTALRNNGQRYYVPVKGVQVNVLKWGWLQVESGTTDGNGNFATGTTYTENVVYNVKFKGTFANVKEGTYLDMANWKSWEIKKGALPGYFNRGTREQFHAMVFNAAYDYFTRVVPLYNITYPNYPVSINAEANGNSSSFLGPEVPFKATVKIARLKDNIYRNSDGIYGSTVHELTHASHYEMDRNFYMKNTRERTLMKESYCEGAETIMTNQRYRMLFGNGYRGSKNAFNTNNAFSLYNSHMQNTLASGMGAYTPLVVDLNDNLNQNTVINTRPVDRVSDYTLKQIQDALNGSRSLNDWRSNLINNYNNPTEANIDDVFNYAQTALNNTW